MELDKKELKRKSTKEIYDLIDSLEILEWESDPVIGNLINSEIFNSECRELLSELKEEVKNRDAQLLEKWKGQ